MAKTVPGPKELAQRELGKKTREGKATRAFYYEGTDPVPVLNETMDAYAGKPRGGQTEHRYGVKPGPKAPRKPKT